MTKVLAVAFLLTAACGGAPSDVLVGGWQSQGGQFTLQFRSDGGFRLWDTNYPPQSLADINPANQAGAKLYGTFAVHAALLSVEVKDALYDNPLAASAGVNVPQPFSTSFSVVDDVLRAPDLPTTVDAYARLP